MKWGSRCAHRLAAPQMVQLSLERARELKGAQQSPQSASGRLTGMLDYNLQRLAETPTTVPSDTTSSPVRDEAETWEVCEPILAQQLIYLFTWLRTPSRDEEPAGCSFGPIADVVVRQCER